ncbi:MAG: phosphoribosylaminoimidazolesuccinocarboxamide synthase, partial [Eggerthellaceae bacterium]|nr:phosphoribosylaminoimidazolesuccinocarboxamide synthase [Eggerthellaceae bacterium]
FVLPEGLREGDRLPEPLFTPSTKAEVGSHDLEESFEQLSAAIGAENAADLRKLSLELYTRARDYAAERGIIIADTKFEFGFVDGSIVLADEALTPDSSRFWPADGWAPGGAQPSFDKQYVRDWLLANWDFTGRPPRLPKEVIARTREKYVAAYEQLTGRPFAW